MVVQLDGDIETAGAKLAAPPAFPAIIADFLRWQPIAPKTPKQLAEITARLCRLLREEVLEQLARSSPALTELAKDWRQLLFPEASDEQFADGYAQAVTFGLLAARARGISLAEGIHHAAHELRKSSSLIGTALGILTDNEENLRALTTSLDTLKRVLDVVHWPSLAKGEPDAWLYFYEDFLEVYDNDLRKRTGSYYTPPGVVDAMTRLVDEALRDTSLFDRRLGLAASDVRVADPAVGTGTFLLGVLARIASTIEADLGAGAVPGAIGAAMARIIGFEIQLGPFAVAQLRLMAELVELMGTATPPELQLFVTDTLGNPFVEEERLMGVYQQIGRSRRDANRIKREEPITVVIGNPPYKEKAKGRGGWIEKGTEGREAPLQRWMPPKEWGVGAHAKHLYNLYVYFWRWASWKVFGRGVSDSTGLPEPDREGIVCFITVAGFLNGPGFERMRQDLRQSCREIWVIDCSPDGHQPEVATRIFQGVQQPVCIVLAARTAGLDGEASARVRFRALPEGRRELKLMALGQMALSDDGWVECPTDQDGRAPFLPARKGAWGSFPALADLFLYNGSGVMPGRTWVIAPDAKSLRDRWTRLTSEKVQTRMEEMFHPHGGGDKTSVKIPADGLHGHEHRSIAIAKDKGACIDPVRYGFRSFDRQWIIPDNRLINRPNPNLWEAHSARQVYLTALEAHAPKSGPCVTFTELVPDLHHYKGSFGGRVYPLWTNSAATEPNIKPALLDHLSGMLGQTILSEDMMAYLAAVLAHPAFTARFAGDLIRPGIRVPMTADRGLFAEAVALGREVLWLHSFGERFADASAGRSHGPPRLPPGERPTIPADGVIPGAPEPLPDRIDHDPVRQRLVIGKGRVDNVPKAVWNYEVSGKKVLRHWFSYRKLHRSRPLIGDKRPPSDLDKIQPESWPAEYTSDLIDLLNVLGRLVVLEPRQADLLRRILAGPLVSDSTVRDAGALAKPPGLLRKRQRMVDDRQGNLGL